MGLVMNAGLVCTDCTKLYEVNRGLRDVPDGIDSGQLACEECQGKLILIAYGVAEQEPTMASIRRFSIERWPFRGLWYKPGR